MISFNYFDGFIVLLSIITEYYILNGLILNDYKFNC